MPAHITSEFAMTQVAQQSQVAASRLQGWQGWPAFGRIGYNVPLVVPPWAGPGVVLAPLDVHGLPPLELRQLVWAPFEQAAGAGGCPTSAEPPQGNPYG